MIFKLELHHVENKATGMIYQLMTIRYTVFGITVWQTVQFIDVQPTRKIRQPSSTK